MPFRFILLLVTTILGGCAGVIPFHQDIDIQQGINTGQYQQAAQSALTKSGFNPEKGTVKDILWALEAGALLNYAGDYTTSNQVLDAAEIAMKQVDTQNSAQNLLQSGLALVGNDKILPYEQTQYDGVMVNTLKAWNFMHLGDTNNARVEWNRAEERQRRAVEFFQTQIQQQEAKLSRENSGRSQDTSRLVNQTLNYGETKAILKANGVSLNEWQPYEGYINPFTTYSYGLNTLVHGQTSSDFSKAANAFKRVYALTSSEQVKQDLDFAMQLAAGESISEPMVWVVYESGEAMVKEEFRIDLPLYIVSNNLVYSGMALPRLRARNAAFPFIKVDDVKTETIADMDKIIGAEFEKGYPMILTREITRAILKTVTQKQINDTNPLAGLAFGLFQAVTTNADTRSFTSLPKYYQTAHFKRTKTNLNLKAGAFDLPVSLDPNARFHIIHVKAATIDTPPIVQVINI